MRLSNLPKAIARSKKRVGRGIGSGRGKTSGRGAKGAKARGKIPLGFIGGTLALYKRLPLKRGWGNRQAAPKVLPLNVAKLGVFKSGSLVNLQSLVEQGIVLARDIKRSGVKIVGGENLATSLTVSLPVSKSAKAAIEKAGGKVESA